MVVEINGLELNYEMAGDGEPLLWLHVGLIRFGGHLSKGEYDVQTDGRHTEATSASTVHR